MTTILKALQVPRVSEDFIIVVLGSLAMTNSETSATQSLVTEPLNVDDKCDVRWRDGDQSLRAKVIERRPLNYRKRKGKRKASKAVDNLKPDEIEYYIHYENHDRRLDEWVTLDKFLLETLERAQPEPEESLDDSRRLRRRSAAQMSTQHNSSNGESEASAMLSGGNWRGGSGDPTFAELEREHEETTKVKNIEKIFMGGWEVECWYFSPYPDEYSEAETLYVCEFCLKYMRKKKTYLKHRAECPERHPPGREIYRELGLSVFEVDGKENRVYCQNLCLLAKLFLDHKTLYYDVDPFYFYIICQVDDSGAHIVGYFSKEKVSAEEYNLACILTFPQYQKHGYGKFIISLSYELSKREEKTGSPEKPLSDLGKISYRSYWTHVLLNLLSRHDPRKDITIKDISMQTGIKAEDIISTLQYLDMIKCWKGQHVVFVNQELIDDYMKQK
eukprot:scaffold4637_cov128-Cylindrotheca_fusiformis.AAC.41